MKLVGSSKRIVFVGLMLTVGLTVVACVEEARPWWLGGTQGLADVATTSFASPTGHAFTEQVIHERTFTAGTAVTTTTYQVGDMTRQPWGIDFNGDRKIDPVVAYRIAEDNGVIQILLSYGPLGTVQFESLTLDGGENLWSGLLDVAVGDIDGDGLLDIVAATEDGVVYLRHPDDAERTHILSEWGQSSGALEIIEGTANTLTTEEVQSIIVTTVDAGINPDNYTTDVDQGYTALEIGDFDNDGDNDIVAARHQNIMLNPKPDIEVEPIKITSGSVQLLLNPGGAQDGQFWTGLAIGVHERHATFDLPGVNDLRAVDIDGDGDLDVVTAATEDQNVQVVWWENLGGPGTLDTTNAWTQHRIGSVYMANRIDVADFTGDGLVDVVASSPEQSQTLLFVQPEEGPDRGFDWFRLPIVTYETYSPTSLTAIDVDNDRRNELVVGGTNGAIRYFEPGLDPLTAWQGFRVVTLDPPGQIGLLGYGDLDGDGDADLVAVVNGDAIEGSRVSWIRNFRIP